MPLGTASLSSPNTLTIECGLETRTLASELGEQTPPVIGDELVDPFWFLLGPQQLQTPVEPNTPTEGFSGVTGSYPLPWLCPFL